MYMYDFLIISLLFCNAFMYDHLFTVYYDIPYSILCLGRILSYCDSGKSFSLVLFISFPYRQFHVSIIFDGANNSRVLLNQKRRQCNVFSRHGYSYIVPVSLSMLLDSTIGYGVASQDM